LCGVLDKGVHVSGLRKEWPPPFPQGEAAVMTDAAAISAGGFDMAAIRPGRVWPRPAGKRAGRVQLWSWALVLSIVLHLATLGAVLVWPSPAPDRIPSDPIDVEIVAEAPPAAQREASPPAAPAVEPPSPALPPVEPPPPVALAPPPVEPPIAAEASPPPALQSPPPVVEAPPEPTPSSAEPPPVAEASPPTVVQPPPPAVEAPPLAEAPPPPALQPPPPAVETPPVPPPPPAEPPPTAEASPPPALQPPPPAVVEAPSSPAPPRPPAAASRPAPAPAPAVKPLPIPVRVKEPIERLKKAPARTARLEAPAAARPTATARTPAAAPAASSAEISAYQSSVLGRISAAKRYPEAARDRGPRGVAVVRFSIAPSGQVASASISQSAGDAILDAEALATVRRASPFPAPPPGAPRIFSTTLSYKIR
jgi:periplasmic protein TonB